LIALFRPDSPDATDAKEQRENNGVAMLAVSSEKDKDDEVETRSSKKSLNMGFLDGIDLSGTVGEAGFKEKAQELPSIASLTRAEWEEKYEKDGKVSLWMEDEFNAGSRLVGAKEDYGKGTGEKSLGNAPVHKVKLTDRDGTIYDLEVPEDQYILWHAEEKGMKLPFACRVGCCTTCAVRIKKGVLVQEQALGIAPQYRQAGYGLMCVAFAKSDLEMELIEEDELYDLQFGDFFNQLATNPNAPNILRDDFALEIADMDE
jgi:ferredoxin